MVSFESTSLYKVNPDKNLSHAAAPGRPDFTHGQLICPVNKVVSSGWGFDEEPL